MEQIELRTTKSEIESFKESILWADIVRELESWRTGFELERGSIVDDAAESNPSTASVLLHLGDLNGRIKAVDYMMSILDVFMSLLEVKEDKDGRDKTN
jgi:hypothetical protein